jgi:choline dehydrogenase-like flavoprotein
MSLTQLLDTDQPFPGGEPDVQRTTFSLDVLGRFVCSTYDEATTNPDFDVVVIGSGMYGAYCAAKIHAESAQTGRTALRVLVLEAGPFLVHERGQNIPDLGLGNPFRPVIDPFGAEAQRTRDLVWGMGWRGNTGFPGTAYCVGGKSLYWGGWCPRLRDPDLAQWPQEVREYLTTPSTFGSNLPNRLAPRGEQSVYEAVEFEIGVQPADDFVFDPVLGPDEPADAIGLNAALGFRLSDALAALRQGGGSPLGDLEAPPIAVQTQSFVSGVFSPDKYSSLTLLISALRDAQGRTTGGSPTERDFNRRLFLVPNAHVSRLQVADVFRDGALHPGDRVTAIELFAGGTRRFLPLKPDGTIVLALGCFESTRLALESFPTAPDRAGDEVMGRNLMAHLRFDFPFQLDRQAFARWVQQNLGRTLRDQLQTASFHLQADTPDGRFHLQGYASGIDTTAQGPDNPEGLLYRMIPDATVAQRLADAQDPNEISLIFRASGEIRADRAAPVHAPGTSWIDLASPADRDQRFDHARAFVNYADQTDAPIWQRMRDACVDLATEIGGRGFQTEDRHEVGSTWHDAGTLFMGDEPSLSVTDTSGHFHHIGNAVCVDQALFPTVGSANPVLTGLCLARKAAETIVARYVSEPPPDDTEIAKEKAEGFVFLLEGAEAQKWRPNHPRFTATRPALIENGSILEVHGDAGLGVLVYDDPAAFGDFELRLQWKGFRDPTSGRALANSGVFLRAPSPPTDLEDESFYERAIEIQIDDTGYDPDAGRFRSPLHRTGAVYKHAPARVHAAKTPSADGTPGFWNEYRITARGSRISVRLNDRLASEGDVPLSLTTPGLVALQYHSGKVQFRAIRIRRL